MANPFQKAKKEKVWTKVLMGGPSGAGKTYSALRMAAGLAKCCGSRVAAIDTEAGRLNYYAEEFDFDGIQLEEFTPEAYVEMINAAADAGYKVLIINSITHEWTYCCDTVNKMPGNSFTNWGKMTPRHDRFMEAILQSLMHIICTVRGKDEYTLEEKNGKQTPKKIGMGYKQRDNTEYEYTITFNIDQATHVASPMKDNTHLFENRYDVLTERDGEALYHWANSGAAPARTLAPKPQAVPTSGSTEELQEQIAEKVSKLVASGVAKDAIGVAVKDACGTANYKKVEDTGLLDAVLTALRRLGGEA